MTYNTIVTKKDKHSVWETQYSFEVGLNHVKVDLASNKSSFYQLFFMKKCLYQVRNIESLAPFVGNI